DGRGGGGGGGRRAHGPVRAGGGGGRGGTGGIRGGGAAVREAPRPPRSATGAPAAGDGVHRGDGRADGAGRGAGAVGGGGGLQPARRVDHALHGPDGQGPVECAARGHDAIAHRGLAGVGCR